LLLFQFLVGHFSNSIFSAELPFYLRAPSSSTVESENLKEDFCALEDSPSLNKHPSGESPTGDESGAPLPSTFLRQSLYRQHLGKRKQPPATTTTNSLSPDDEAVFLQPTSKPAQGTTAELPTRLTASVKKQLISELPKPLQQHFESGFGKDSLEQSFYGEVKFRHVHIFLVKYTRLWLESSDFENLCMAFPSVCVVAKLWDEHRNVDIEPLRGFTSYQNWEKETTVNEHRITMTTACMMQFNCCIPSVIRYIGGPHVGAQRDVDAIVEELKKFATPTIRRQVESIYRNGAPMFCQAESTNDNFREYYRYGNHKSVAEHPELAYKALAKDYRKGYTILMHPKLTLFIPHIHLTPQGIVVEPGKKERPVFDSSCRVKVFCFSINDWTDPLTEPEVTFSKAFMNFLVWIWNLRITYPFRIILLGDDDVSGAFRLAKHNPQLVGMHGFQMCGLLGFYTGLTFGGCTSPSIWQALATAIEQAS
jgi:hypothetical protein